MTSTDMFSAIQSLLDRGEPFVLATVVASYKPQSVRPGAKAIVHADGTIEGWVGGGCVRPVMLQEAREALEDGRPRLVRMNAGEARGGCDGVRDYPMTCQGEGGLEVYLEPVRPAPRLVILGATPVAQSLARFGGELGFAVSVSAAAGAAELFPAGTRLLAEPGAALARAGAGDAVVVATMGMGDEEALAAAVACDAGYVGLVASRKKARFLFDYLRAHGVDAERLARVTAPAGLDLGGMGAAEIALSIAAEIVARRHAARPAASGSAKATVPAPTPDPMPPVPVPPDPGPEPQPDPWPTPLPDPRPRPQPHPMPLPDPRTPVSAPVAAPTAMLSGARPRRQLDMAALPIDPVCGMPVDPATAKHALVVGGTTVYFCCPHCKAAYEKARARGEP